MQKLFKSSRTALMVMATLLPACSNNPQGVRIINGATSAPTSKQAAAIRNFSAAEIAPAVSGKTFQFTRTGASGFVTFNADGTLSVTDDQKGPSVGKWSTSTGQYCETYSPALPLECGVFKFTGDAYFAANSRLVEMKV